MNVAHNYHKNIKMYVLRCTTIGLKQECGHKTSRGVDMNLRFKPHFTAKNRSENEIVLMLFDAIHVHICSVAYRYVYLNPYREGYTIIYRVIGIIL